MGDVGLAGLGRLALAAHAWRRHIARPRASSSLWNAGEKVSRVHDARWAADV